MPWRRGRSRLCCRWIDQERAVRARGCQRAGRPTVTRTMGRSRRDAADAGRRRRARRRLAPDGLQRGQQPRPAARRHPRPGAGGDRRARLLAQPRRPQPAHPRLAPDRAADQPGAGGHRQRHDGPLRALAGGDLARGRLPRAALRRRATTTRWPAYDDLLRSTAVDAFVVTDTYLGNPQAAWLDERAGRRSSPSAGRGTTPTPGTRGSTSTARPAPTWPPPTCSSAGHQRIAWIGWRKDSRIGEDRRSGWSRAMRARGPAHHRPGLPGRGHRRQRPRGQRRAARRGAAHGVRLRLRHPRHGRAAHARPSAACAPGRDVAVVGFDDSQVAQTVPPGLTSVRQPLEQVAVEMVRALEGLLGHPPASRPRRAARAHAGGARLELRACRIPG